MSRTFVVLLPLFLVCCGQSGPSRLQVETALNAFEAALAAEIPTAPSRVTVTESSCTAGENGIYTCAVTAAGTRFVPDVNAVRLRRINGTWTVITG